jgi:hypothetical protein
MSVSYLKITNLITVRLKSKQKRELIIIIIKTNWIFVILFFTLYVL